MRTLFALLLLPAALGAQALTPHQQLGRDLMQEMIGINTVEGIGNTTLIADKLAARFIAAGFPAADVQVVGPKDVDKNIVVRLRGSGRSKAKPILLLAHLDVVAARREDWSIDPFTLTEKDGWFYGRGTEDVKSGAAMLASALLRMKQEHIVPDRDLILALTAGEEGSSTYNGVEWLLANRRDLIDAEYCLNADAGGGDALGGHPISINVQAAEKVYQSFNLTVHNRGGHSSLPRPDNAIYQLAAGLQRISKFTFPTQPNAIVRLYFERSAQLDRQHAADFRALADSSHVDEAAAARLSRDAFYNSILRTTCVATMLDGGHAPNALPQTAHALVNCRMLPGVSPDSVRATLQAVVADSGILVEFEGRAVQSPPSIPSRALLDAIAKVGGSVWGQLPVVPYMETGATDGLALRNAGMPVFGVTGIIVPSNDVRAHGRDERIGVRAFYDGIEFQYRLLKLLTSAR
ncbi:MAG: hypothetical protein JWO05_719 [Gemmatimonadetes bacterium]|nr:hypothetical protein [Gemmatimonadota bacterium]